ncbi:acetylcholine receptor subunit alpha-type acr-16-like [Gigantopelta aegis]|uniref:acetylcholine receptor subunit alpha-type acr-16-like n=1 Tax=Gigantopelta aegis TaxID=1735272 RepID=UPI001B889C45|nr:acetylcholine receptor subunit alpha-type acr-16-like [Gigantopelta aegis]
MKCNKCLSPTESEQGIHERRLLNYLFQNGTYNTMERPVENESDALDVAFGIILQQIIDVDEKNQIINTNLWLQLTWTDVNMVWDPSEFGNVSSVRVRANMVWKPDILMYNSADDAYDSTYHTNVIASSTGKMLWVPPGMFKSTCLIDIKWFPFDDQKCELKFGSWTHDGRLLNLTADKESGGDTSSFIRNGEWELLGLPVKRNILAYECCPEFYIDLTFTIHIRRRTLYYGFNIIIPCVLISSMSLLLFILPPDAGEKISLGTTILLSMMVFLLQVSELMPSTSDATPLIGVTILLSLMVFLLLVAETMPPTSDALPLIGIYFACIMIMCSLSVLFTVIVLNLHYRTPDTHIMPSWIKVVICHWLAAVLFMKRPGGNHKYSLRLSRLADMSLEEKSKSLMANVLDMDDDICIVQQNGIPPKPEESITQGIVLHSVRQDIVSILKEVRKITAKFQKDDEHTSVKNDWKFAAMVIDRLCFILCVSFTVASTAGVLGSAPHLIA